MTSRGKYQITKRIKLHTKPIRYADIPLVGTFKYDTDNWYCFDEFRVKKANVVEIKVIAIP